jgi:hypothetical protein
MADIRAAQSGDFSATTTWVGGVVPGSGDVAFSNTFTVTISDTRTVQAISNASGTGITVGGTFSLLNGCNLTCTNANGVVQGATTTSCVTTPGLTLGNAATINASISVIGNARSISFSTAGTLNLNGNYTDGVLDYTSASSGNLNIVGNLTAGGGADTSHALNVSGSGNVTITGNIAGSLGFRLSHGINILSGATVTVTGSVTGGNRTGSYGIQCSVTSVNPITVNGPCQSSSLSPAIGQAFTNGGNPLFRLTGPLLVGATGNYNPVFSHTWRWAPTQIPTYYEVPTSDGTTKRNLYTADNIPTANYPTQGNVRSGTVYGPNLENTGTLAVPAPGSVALGVATDNTTGTAVLTSANVQTALGAFSSGRLNNVATVDTTGAQIQAAVNT